MFLATTIGLYRSERLRPFWPISLAYLAVSLGLLLALILGRWLPDPDSLASSPMMAVTLGKLFDVAAVVLPVLLLPRLAGEVFGALYLQRGRLGGRFPAPAHAGPDGRRHQPEAGRARGTDRHP